MQQPCALIAGLIFAAGITAVFGMGSQPIPEPTVKKTTSTVDATAIYNQGVALMHEKRYAAAIADFEAAVKANQTLPKHTTTLLIVFEARDQRSTTRRLTTITKQSSSNRVWPRHTNIAAFSS